MSTTSYTLSPSTWTDLGASPCQVFLRSGRVVYLAHGTSLPAPSSNDYLVFTPGSVNDHNVTNGGVAIGTAGNATVQAAYQTYIKKLMAAQPNAIIVGAPQEMANAAGADATRVAAYKAGFLAAAGWASRMIWLDNTVFESAPDTGVIGADTVHPGGVFGARHIGERLARQVLTALRAL